MTKIKKIFDFIEELQPGNDFVITGGFALYLHSLNHKIDFYRDIKDLDLYTFKKIKQINQKNYFDEYTIKNNKIRAH